MEQLTRASTWGEEGQTTVETVLLLVIVVGIFYAATQGINRLGLAQSLAKLLSQPFAATYQFGHPQGKGYGEDDGPQNHPRASTGSGSGGGNNFRIFVNKNSGQSTVEFALTLSLFLAFVLFYFQVCMVMAFGSYVQYATFMAARAYKAANQSPQDQIERATQVLTGLVKLSVSQPNLDRFASVARGVGGNSDVPGLFVNPPSEYQPNNRAFSWMQGIRYTFRSSIFLIPLSGTGPAGQSQTALGAGVNQLTLTSESWLGKETSYSECRAFLAAKNWLFIDNGC